MPSFDFLKCTQKSNKSLEKMMKNGLLLHIQLRTHTALAEDTGSNPSSHARQPTACNFSFGGSNASGHHEFEKQWISEGSGRRGMKKQPNKVKRNLVHRGRISESHS